MGAAKRLQKELEDLRKAAGKSFRDIQVPRFYECCCQFGKWTSLEIS